MVMDFPSLVQVGINNVIVAKANGREMSIYELRLIDQFSKTTYASLRLQELAIQEELDHHDDTGKFTEEDPPEGTESEGDRSGPPFADV